MARKKVLILGPPGSGKSALCDSLSKPLHEPHGPHENQIFLESHDPGIEGERGLVRGDVNILGNEGNPITLINTVGLDSNNRAGDMAQLLEANGCDQVHVFGIVVNSLTRISSSLIYNIHAYESVFGTENFWSNAVIILNNHSSSIEDIDSFCMALRRSLEIPQHIDLNTFVLTAKYTSAESERFQRNVQRLLGVIYTSDGARLLNVRDRPRMEEVNGPGEPSENNVYYDVGLEVAKSLGKPLIGYAAPLVVGKLIEKLPDNIRNKGADLVVRGTGRLWNGIVSFVPSFGRPTEATDSCVDPTGKVLEKCLEKICECVTDEGSIGMTK